MGFPATIFDFRTSPAFIVWKLARHSVLLKVDSPDRLPLIRSGQVEEECSQRETPSQFGWQASDGIAGRNEQHSPLRYSIDDLKGGTQPLGRSTYQGTLHGRQVESNRGDPRRTACCL